jgi:hypothetical protein
MTINKHENSTFKLFIALNIFVIAVAFTKTLAYNPDSILPTIGNYVLIFFILISFFLFGKYRFTEKRILFFLFCLLLYIIKPGIFTFGVPLIPLIGIFLTLKKHDFELFKKMFIRRAKIISLITFAIIYLILFISKLYFGGGTANLVSITAIYIIVLNMIFFRVAFSSTVILAVLLSSLFTPGLGSYGETPTLSIPNTHQGNRSAVFLLLFLISLKHLKYFYSIIIKKKYFTLFIFSIIPLTILLLSMLNDFMQRVKMSDIFSDPRFQWFMPMFQLLINEGPISFFNNGSEILSNLGDGRRNPHNSFFYLLLEQYWLGLFKIIIFLASIFTIPFSAWLAIAGRASFDIFFLLGPQDIILVILFSEFYNFRFKRSYNLNFSRDWKKNEKVNT